MSIGSGQRRHHSSGPVSTSWTSTRSDPQCGQGGGASSGRLGLTGRGADVYLGMRTLLPGGCSPARGVCYTPRATSFPETLRDSPARESNAGRPPSGGGRSHPPVGDEGLGGEDVLALRTATPAGEPLALALRVLPVA